MSTSTDRLTWMHKVGEQASVQFTAEGFNIANWTNFASVNTEVTPSLGLTPGFTTCNVRGVRPGTALASGGITTADHTTDFHLRLTDARDSAEFTLQLLSCRLATPRPRKVLKSS